MWNMSMSNAEYATPGDAILLLEKLAREGIMKR